MVDIGVIEDGAVRLSLDVGSTITRKTMDLIEVARRARLGNPRSSDLTLQRDRPGSRASCEPRGDRYSTQSFAITHLHRPFTRRDSVA